MKATITLRPSDDAPLISPDLYAHFAEHLGHCIYGGLWVGEDSDIPNTRGIRNDVVQALRDLQVPVLRWPGGCFADEYHWKDGIGQRAQRPRMYNSHWGGVVENNHFGTHEFFDLCQQIGCEAYVCGNVGSGTVQEMSEWVEYMTSPAQSPMADLRRKNGRDEPWKLKYFGVGNESWGCGGHMRPEYYADLYRRYNTFVRTYGSNKILRIACGPNNADFRWTEVLTEQARDHMDGLALHYYTVLDQTWPPSGSATKFCESEYYSTLRSALRMEELIVKHSEIMDRFDPEGKVSLVVDEWGTWHPVEPGTNPGFLFQQNAMRDALVASVHFDIFHRHCQRVRMANIAQMVNVLQAMVLTDGPRMLLTPTYWVFHMYAVHQGGKRVDPEMAVEEVHGVPAVSATASLGNNQLAISLSCLDAEQGREVTVELPSGFAHVESSRRLSGRPQDHNTFDQPSAVQPVDFQAVVAEGKLSLSLPPCSVSTVVLS